MLYSTHSEVNSLLKYKPIIFINSVSHCIWRKTIIAPHLWHQAVVWTFQNLQKTESFPTNAYLTFYVFPLSISETTDGSWAQKKFTARCPLSHRVVCLCNHNDVNVCGKVLHSEGSALKKKKKTTGENEAAWAAMRPCSLLVEQIGLIYTSVCPSVQLTSSRHNGCVPRGEKYL